jgi:hypothetical protein
VVSRLVDEVRGLNPNFLTQHIRGVLFVAPNHCCWRCDDTCNLSFVCYFGSADASYRFYRTRCEEKSVTRRGLAAEKQKRKRMRERITRVSFV